MGVQSPKLKVGWESQLGTDYGVSADRMCHLIVLASFLDRQSSMWKNKTQIWDNLSSGPLGNLCIHVSVWCMCRHTVGAGVSEEEHEAKVLHLNSWLGWYCKQTLNTIQKMENFQNWDCWRRSQSNSITPELLVGIITRQCWRKRHLTSSSSWFENLKHSFDDCINFFTKLQNIICKTKYWCFSPCCKTDL